MGKNYSDSREEALGGLCSFSRGSAGSDITSGWWKGWSLKSPYPQLPVLAVL